jgi:hypothetical protein
MARGVLETAQHIERERRRRVVQPVRPEDTFTQARHHTVLRYNLQAIGGRIAPNLEAHRVRAHVNDG